MKRSRRPSRLSHPGWSSVAVSLALAGVSVVAPAQTATAQVTDIPTDRARELMKEGDVQYGKQEWVKARTAYIAAWALKKHWSIAASLGDTELRMGLHQEAAEHLAAMLTLSPPEDRRKDGEKLLAEAKQHVGTIDLRVEPSGTDVSVNGEPRGRTPLAAPIFLKPGTHTIELKKVGFLSRGKTLEVQRGATEVVTVQLEPEGGVAPGGPKGPQGPTPPGGPGKGQPPEPRPLWPAVLLGVGGGTLLVGGASLLGAAFAVRGGADDDLGSTFCDAANPACDESNGALDTANTLGAAGLTGLIVGALSLGGMALYLAIPDSSVQVKTTGTGLFVEGSF
jgi:hypothetical protein